MKKKYTGREWSENRFSRFQVGIIIALLLIFYAFQYESARPIYLEDDSTYVEPPGQTVSVNFKTPPLLKQIIKSPELSTEIEPVQVEMPEELLVSTDPSSKQSAEQLTSGYSYEKAAQLPLPAEEDPEIEEITSNEAVTFAEQMPLLAACMSKFETYDEQRACTTSEIMKVIRKDLDYPSIARENGIEGTVTASFVVNIEGEITDIKIVREAGFGLDEAVLKVFQKIPNLIPGEQNGRKVNVRMFVPVKFKLAK